MNKIKFVALIGVLAAPQLENIRVDALGRECEHGRPVIRAWKTFVDQETVAIEAMHWGEARSQAETAARKKGKVVRFVNLDTSANDFVGNSLDILDADSEDEEPTPEDLSEGDSELDGDSEVV